MEGKLWADAIFSMVCISSERYKNQFIEMVNSMIDKLPEIKRARLSKKTKTQSLFSRFAKILDALM